MQLRRLHPAFCDSVPLCPWYGFHRTSSTKEGTHLPPLLRRMLCSLIFCWLCRLALCTRLCRSRGSHGARSCDWLWCVIDDRVLRPLLNKRTTAAGASDGARSDQLSAVGVSCQCVYLEAAVQTDMRLVANLRIALRTRNQHIGPSLHLVCVRTECLVRPRQTGLSAFCLLSSFRGMESTLLLSAPTLHSYGGSSVHGA